MLMIGNNLTIWTLCVFELEMLALDRERVKATLSSPIHAGNIERFLLLRKCRDLTVSIPSVDLRGERILFSGGGEDELDGG